MSLASGGHSATHVGLYAKLVSKSIQAEHVQMHCSMWLDCIDRERGGHLSALIAMERDPVDGSSARVRDV